MATDSKADQPSRGSVVLAVAGKAMVFSVVAYGMNRVLKHLFERDGTKVVIVRDQDGTLTGDVS